MYKSTRLKPALPTAGSTGKILRPHRLEVHWAPALAADMACNPVSAADSMMCLEVLTEHDQAVAEDIRSLLEAVAERRDPKVVVAVEAAM
jgi:hypothetical protein